MNLIEQLGGYSAAKAKLESLNGQFYKTMEPERFLFEMDNQQKLSVIISALEIAMLEYRRQHNIYEVGDSFVFNNGDNSEIMKVQHVWDDAVWGGYCGEIPKITDIRHATEAEIQAGRRL